MKTKVDNIIPQRFLLHSNVNSSSWRSSISCNIIHLIFIQINFQWNFISFRFCLRWIKHCGSMRFHGQERTLFTIPQTTSFTTTTVATLIQLYSTTIRHKCRTWSIAHYPLKIFRLRKWLMNTSETNWSTNATRGWQTESSTFWKLTPRKAFSSLLGLVSQCF